MMPAVSSAGTADRGTDGLSMVYRIVVTDCSMEMIHKQDSRAKEEDNSLL